MVESVRAQQQLRTVDASIVHKLPKADVPLVCADRSTVINGLIFISRKNNLSPNANSNGST